MFVQQVLLYLASSFFTVANMLWTEWERDLSAKNAKKIIEILFDLSAKTMKLRKMGYIILGNITDQLCLLAALTVVSLEMLPSEIFPMNHSTSRSLRMEGDGLGQCTESIRFSCRCANETLHFYSSSPRFSSSRRYQVTYWPSQHGTRTLGHANMNNRHTLNHRIQSSSSIEFLLPSWLYITCYGSLMYILYCAETATIGRP